MPVTVFCGNCGKRYTVPDAGVGRRGKCRRCGHVFTVTARPPGVARPPAAVHSTDGSRLTAAAARARAALGPVGVAVGRFEADTLVMLAAVVVAGVFLAASAVTWASTSVALIVFPAGGAVYLACRFGLLARKLVRTPGALRVRVPWVDILLIGGQVALRAFVHVPFFVYRRPTFSGVSDVGVAAAAGVVIRSGSIALLGVGLYALPMVSGHWREYAAYHHWTAPGWPPAVATLDRWGGGTPATRTEAHLGRIASAIRIYTVGHHGPPPSLADLDLPDDYDDPLVSPFDPSAGRGGYVYLPRNGGPSEWHAYLYDAGELRRTGTTHAVSKKDGERVVTRGELADWAGVAIP